MQDRRKFTDADLEALGDVFAHKLSDRFSLKKNGETWGEWLGRNVTLERAIMVFVAVLVSAFTFGGQLRDAKEQLKRAADQAAAASEKADLAADKSASAARKAEAAALTNGDLQTQITALQQQITERAHQQELFRSEVRAKLQKLEVMPTRRELKEAIDVSKTR